MNSYERGFLSPHARGGRKKMTISKDHLELEVQTNHDLQANIWEALRKEAALRSLDLGSLAIKAQNGEVYLTGYLKEENLPLIENAIYSVVGIVEIHNHLRTNDSILADIWDALWKVDTFRSLDLGSLSIEVKGGEVYLYGYLAQENNRPMIERIAQSVTGVVAVHSHLILDRDLIIQVSQALARDERTRPYILPVDAYHGWIHIGGEVPTCELQQVAEKVAGGVPGVRGVTIQPRIAGENSTMLHHRAQPRIGAVVYGQDGEIGTVTQVVIQPDTRLVTHAVVRSNELADGKLAAREMVIPLDARDLVKNESIILQRNKQRLAKPAHALKAFPTFDPDEFPLAPFTWQAPYPYTAGEVRWSLREILEAGNRPASQPEL
jgi:osmotically-inducible protein OsmY/sporulation protein YlmC with PRC-barrel domain